MFKKRRESLTLVAIFAVVLCVLFCFQNCAPPVQPVSPDVSGEVTRGTPYPTPTPLQGTPTPTPTPYQGQLADGVCTSDPAQNAMAVTGYDISGAPLYVFKNGNQAAIWNLVDNGVSGSVTHGSVCYINATGWQISAIGRFAYNTLYQGSIPTLSPDVIWHNTNGQNLIWIMSGASEVANAYLPTTATTAQIEGVGDFNGDGRSDILWRDTSTGAVTMWLMTGWQTGDTMGSPTIASVGTMSSSWHILAVSDFNGDGMADILWKSSTGALELWMMNGSTIAHTYTITTSHPANSSIIAVGNFGGNGYAGILWQSSVDYTMTMWEMNNGGVTNSIALAAGNSSWQAVFMEDVDSNGTDDILWNANGTYLNTWTMQGYIPTGASQFHQIQTGWTPFKYPHL